MIDGSLFCLGDFLCLFTKHAGNSTDVVIEGLRIFPQIMAESEKATAKRHANRSSEIFGKRGSFGQMQPYGLYLAVSLATMGDEIGSHELVRSVRGVSREEWVKFNYAEGITGSDSAGAGGENFDSLGHGENRS